MNNRISNWSVAMLIITVAVSTATIAADSDKKRGATPPTAQAMSNQKLDALIRRLDESAKGQLGFWQLTVESRALLVVTDEKANRMRIMTPVTEADKVDEKTLVRLLQANFDTALDARYAVAQGKLWSVFIHPLGPLTELEFVEGLGQVFNLAESFGGSYSSGLLIFRGGDSGEMRGRELIDRLKKRGRLI